MKMKEDTISKKPCSSTQVHSVRFYNLAPRAICCMDYNKTDHKLALARNDGSIEIWDLKNTPYLEKSAPKFHPDATVESIVWTGKRLFTAGLNGEVVEWCFATMEPRWQQRVTGNAIWCLAVNRKRTELAIGTEEGYINIFDIENDEFQYKRLFDKQEGRVLCCSFDATGNHFVTGSVGALRIWNATTGHAIHKMTLPKTRDNKKSIVWTLKILNDFSIIAGDSRGCITVYDGNTGYQLETHQVLKADILAICVSENEQMLACSGIEPLIRIYARTQIKREDLTYFRWIKYLQRCVHDHDVKSLVCTDSDMIVSGGVDGYLGFSAMIRMKAVISRHGPFLRSPCASVAVSPQLLLLRYPAYFEIWRLASANPYNPEEDNNLGDNSDRNTRGVKSFTLATCPVKLLEFRSKNDEPITCTTISPDGQWLCYSTLKELRMFRFIAGTTEISKNEPSQLLRCRNKGIESTPALHVAFSTDSKRLFLLPHSRKQVLIYSLTTRDDDNEFDLIETIDLCRELKGTIIHFALSDCGKQFAIADDDHLIAVYAIGESNIFKHRLNLPRYEQAATTAIAIGSTNGQHRLVASYSNNLIVEYDLKRAQSTCSFDQTYIVPNTETHCVTQILLDSRNPNIILLQNDGYLYAMEKYDTQNEDDANYHDDENIGKKKTKKIKKNLNNSKGKTTSMRLKFQKSYEHLVHTSWLSSDALVTISVNRTLLIEQLPAAFRQKKYRQR